MALHNPPSLAIAGSWQELLQPTRRAALEALLPGYIHHQRWFGAKTRQIVSAQIIDSMALATGAGLAYLTLVELAYASGGSERYLLPLTVVPANEAANWLRDRPQAAVALLHGEAGDNLLLDALFEPSFCLALLELISHNGSIAGERGTLRGQATVAFKRLRAQISGPLTPNVGTAEQSNTSIIYGGHFIMKLFRKLEPGLNPDVEIGSFLTNQRAFAHVPPVCGALEYQRTGQQPASVALLQGFVPNQGDAWSHAVQSIAQTYERVLADQLAAPEGQWQQVSLLELAEQPPSAEAQRVAGDYLAAAELLGRRTAELHLALTGDANDAEFAPVPFDAEYRNAVYASMKSRAANALQALRKRQEHLPEQLTHDAQRILNQEAQIQQRMRAVVEQPTAALRIRIHGDYHLGQLLYTGEDFFIIDFEGEPARPMHERRLKSSPLQDVAGMLRSLHYAPYAVLLGQAAGTSYEPQQLQTLGAWARFWQRSVGAVFLRSYLAAIGQSPLIPPAHAGLQALLETYLLDKALYELAYELNNRPAWVHIPIEGIVQLLGDA